MIPIFRKLGWLARRGTKEAELLRGLSGFLGEAERLLATLSAFFGSLALWAARYAKSLLFGITASDPLTMAVTIALLLAAAALAGYIPARRAVLVDTIQALRCE